MESKLARPRAVMYGSLAVAFVIGAPWIGWWTLIPLAGAVLSYSLFRPRFATSERPEYLVAATVVIAQILIGIGIALSGGPHSPVIAMLLLPIVTLPARFSARGVWAGLGVTIVVLLLSTAATAPAALVDDPTYTLVGLATAIGLAAFAQALMHAEMQQRSDAVLDPLTGLLNRKALASRFDEIAQQAALTGAPVCLVACDLDRFKQVNDAHGHERGDAVLKDAAYLLRKYLRSFELAYRLGGEEFLIVLPGVGARGGPRGRAARLHRPRGRATRRPRRHRVVRRGRGERCRRGVRVALPRGGRRALRGQADRAQPRRRRRRPGGRRPRGLRPGG